jgi:hypothetical protein
VPSKERQLESIATMLWEPEILNRLGCEFEMTATSYKVCFLLFRFRAYCVASLDSSTNMLPKRQRTTCGMPLQNIGPYLPISLTSFPHMTLPLRATYQSSSEPNVLLLQPANVLGFKDTTVYLLPWHPVQGCEILSGQPAGQLCYVHSAVLLLM